MAASRAQKDNRPNAVFWRIYMFSWAVLAGGAMTYVASVGLKPDLLNKIRLTPLDSQPQSNRAELDRAALTAKVNTLKDRLANLRTDLANVKQTVGKQSQLRLETTSGGGKSANADVAGLDANTAPGLTGSSRVDGSGIQGPARIATRFPVSDEKPDSDTRATVATAGTPAVTPERHLDRRRDSETIIISALVPPTASTSTGDEAEKAPDAASGSGELSAASRTLGGKTAQQTKELLPPASVAPPTPRLARTGPNLAVARLVAGGTPPIPTRSPFRPVIAQSAPKTQSAPTPAAPRLSHRAQQTSRLQTGSISPARPVAKTSVAKPKPVTFGRPQVTTGGRRAAALALSSSKSITGLKASWLLLTTRHGDLLRAFEPRYASDTRSGNYRLIAGPIVSRSEADRICTLLRAKNVDCGVADYLGSAL